MRYIRNKLLLLLCQSHTMTSRGREPATMRIAAYRSSPRYALRHMRICIHPIIKRVNTNLHWLSYPGCRAAFLISLIISNFTFIFQLRTCLPTCTWNSTGKLPRSTHQQNSSPCVHPVWLLLNWVINTILTSLLSLISEIIPSLVPEIIINP